MDNMCMSVLKHWQNHEELNVLVWVQKEKEDDREEAEKTECDAEAYDKFTVFQIIWFVSC